MSGDSRSNIGAHENYTLNFDGSYINQQKKVGVGCIIRDNQENLIVAASYNLSKEFFNYCDVAVAEAAALRNGLKLAKNFNIKLNVIRGDSQEVINHVELGCNSRSKRSFKKYLKGVRQPLSGIIQEIVGMLDRSETIQLIYREANQVADKLASLGSNNLQGGHKRLFLNDAELPPQVAKLVNDDKSYSSSMAEIISTPVRKELIKQLSDMTGYSHQKTAKLIDALVSSESSKLQGGHKLATTHDANLPPQKTCGSEVREVKFLEGKVCKNCDELQTKLTMKDKRIAELEVKNKNLMNQKLKLEGKRRDLKNSVDTMNKELCQMRDEKMKATKRENACDELQTKLTMKDKKIAELEVENKFLMNQKMKLEGKGRDLENSMDTMNKELCQMRDEKMKATKRVKYEFMIALMVWVLLYIIYTRV